MPFKVVNTIHSPHLDFGEHLLEPFGAVLVNGLWRTEEELIENAADADAVVCSGPVQPWSARVIDAMDRCRILASLGVGYDRIDLAAAARNLTAVTNIPDYCIDEVAGHTIALVLALGRGLLRTDRMVRRRSINFVPPNRAGVRAIDPPLGRLCDQTLGIVGLGRIGSATARKAQGLGMRVIACDPGVLDNVIESRGIAPVDFDTLLAEADYVCVNAALTPETRGMFDAAAFGRMKTTAYFINTARGEIVDEPALVRALETGQVAGAGLDVSDEDPVGPKNPLLALENVILTGHSAWHSTRADSGPVLWHQAMAQVAAALSGRWPVYAVNGELRERWIERWGPGGSS